MTLRHLYVIEIRGRGVKVGVTQDWPQRLAQHRQAIPNYGAKMGRVWRSLKHGEALDNERALMRLMGPDNRSEFLPLAFEPVVAFAKTLVRTEHDGFVEEFCRALDPTRCAADAAIDLIHPHLKENSTT